MSDSVFVHDRALCESEDVGNGTRIWAFAHVMSGAQVGRDCNVCGGVFIEAGATVGDRVTVKNNVLLWDRVQIDDDVFLGPNAVFTNDLDPRAAFKKEPADFRPTFVGRGATIGANATIVAGNRLGESCFVGAGAVVVADVPAHSIVVGNPARHVGWMCTCGARLDERMRCGACGREFEPEPKSCGLRQIA